MTKRNRCLLLLLSLLLLSHHGGNFLGNADMMVTVVALLTRTTTMTEGFLSTSSERTAKVHCSTGCGGVVDRFWFWFFRRCEFMSLHEREMWMCGGWLLLVFFCVSVLCAVCAVFGLLFSAVVVLRDWVGPRRKFGLGCACTHHRQMDAVAE